MKTLAMKTNRGSKINNSYSTLETHHKLSGVNMDISKAGSKGGSYGAVVGAILGLIISYGQIAIDQTGGMNFMLTATLAGIAIGAAVGSLDNSFKSYQTRRNNLAM